MNPARPLPLLLEERLHRVHDQLALVADVLNLHASVLCHTDHALGADGARALAAVCHAARSDLDELLQTLPGDLLSWPEQATRRRP